MTKYEVTISGLVFRVIAASETLAALKAADEYQFDTGHWPTNKPFVYDLSDEAEFWGYVQGVGV